MRIIVYGAGAIGAALGAGLSQAGYEVALIARGAHARAMREHGVCVESHAGVARLRLPVAEHPRELSPDSARDIVVLAMKTLRSETRAACPSAMRRSCSLQASTLARNSGLSAGSNPR